MKKLILLLCLISPPVFAQAELAGLSLRIQPVPVMPKNLQGRLGFWSLSTGGTANHTLLHTIGGVDLDFDLGPFLPLAGGTMNAGAFVNLNGGGITQSLGMSGVNGFSFTLGNAGSPLGLVGNAASTLTFGGLGGNPKTILSFTAPTAIRNLVFPDKDGTVATLADVGTTIGLNSAYQGAASTADNVILTSAAKGMVDVRDNATPIGTVFRVANSDATSAYLVVAPATTQINSIGVTSQIEFVAQAKKLIFTGAALASNSSGDIALGKTSNLLGTMHTGTSSYVIWHADTTNTNFVALNAPAATGQRVWTLPDVTDTVVGLAASQTLTNKTITAPVLSGSVTGTFTIAGTPTLGASLAIGTTATYAVGDTTHLLTALASAKLIGGSSNTSGHTVPNVADDTFVLLAASQTLASKTLTAPVINGATSSGSTALDFSGNSGAFKTSTGAHTFGSASWSTPANTVITAAASLTNTVGLKLVSNVADGASSVGLAIDNTTANANGKNISFRNAGTERAFIAMDTIVAGSFVIQQPSTTYMAFFDSSLNGLKIQSQAVYLRGGAGVDRVTLSSAGTSWSPVSDAGVSLGLKAQRWSGLFNSSSMSCGHNLQSGTTFTATSTDCWVVMSNAAAKTVTMPAASAVPAGGLLYILDGSANASTQNISVARAGSDTINGGTGNVAVVTANNAHSTCESDGSTKWICGVNN